MEVFMYIPLPREAEDDIIDKPCGMPTGEVIKMMEADGVHMNMLLDGEPPTNPILPCQSTVNRPREME